MAIERKLGIQDHAAETMPQVADAIYRAAAMLSPILGPKFYGEFYLKWEEGKPVYYRITHGNQL
jgi:hypothetical protein